MLYTVSEGGEAHVYAWLVMCPRTVIIYIIIVYILGVSACMRMRVCACVRACMRACVRACVRAPSFPTPFTRR